MLLLAEHIQAKMEVGKKCQAISQNKYLPSSTYYVYNLSKEES